MGGIRAGANDQASTTASAIALAIAFAVGALSLLSPTIAVLALALLGARVLMRAETAPINLLSLAGPVFAALIVGAFVGLAGAIGVLFVWRLLADTSWSVREAARLAVAAAQPAQSKTMASLHAWLTPLFGLAVVAYTAPHMVAGLPLDLPHVPSIVPIVLGLLAAGAFLDWLLRRAVEWRLGELAPAPALHMAAHHVLFLAAFGVSFDVSAGVVALMAWRLAHAAPLALRQPSLTAVP